MERGTGRVVVFRMNSEVWSESDSFESIDDFCIYMSGGIQFMAEYIRRSGDVGMIKKVDKYVGEVQIPQPFLEAFNEEEDK